MKTYHCLFPFLLTCCLLPLTALAAGNPVLDIRNGYVRGLPPGSKTTAAYMTLANKSDQPMVLTGGSSPVAESVTLHKTVNRAGVMGMEPVESANLPAHGMLELKSGGLHLMLTGLKRPLRTGSNVELTLRFEDGYLVTVQLPVISVLEE